MMSSSQQSRRTTIPNLYHYNITMSKPVSIQPSGTYHFNNTFAPLSGENILKLYECEEGCSKCCGPKAHVAITNTRVIAREQEAKRCICCGEGSHVDIAIYLRDIEVLTESKARSKGCFGGCCSVGCGGDIPKYISVKGGFGAEVLTFPNTVAIEAANELAALIQPFKERR